MHPSLHWLPQAHLTIIFLLSTASRYYLAVLHSDASREGRFLENLHCDLSYQKRVGIRQELEEIVGSECCQVQAQVHLKGWCIANTPSQFPLEMRVHPVQTIQHASTYALKHSYQGPAKISALLTWRAAGAKETLLLLYACPMEWSTNLMSLLPAAGSILEPPPQARAARANGEAPPTPCE
eukprot:6435568-Amphidinium_carterae.1